MAQNGFIITINDSRFDGYSVRNSGTASFQVLRKNVIVDSFEDVGATSRTGVVEPAEAERRAREYFDMLAGHPWLFKAYEKVI